MRRYLLICICFLFQSLQNNVSAQGYKIHYIAPAPWQYWSQANELVVSTQTAGTIVTVKKSNGTLVTTLTVAPSSPSVYRFSGNPNTLAQNALNTVLSDRGLIVEGNYPINVNIRNVASDIYTDNNIKGNSSLYSFGDAAIGTSFRLGYYRDGDLSGTTFKRPVYSIMAIQNSTIVSLNGTAIATLNAGQSYNFQTPIGSLVTTTGPAVMNSGINIDAPVSCGDGVYNPVPPISSLGKEYVSIRTGGNNTAEQTTVVATQANTTVTVANFNSNGVYQSTSTYTLLAAGSFATFPTGIPGTGTGSAQTGNQYSASRIVANKPVVGFSGTANNCEIDMITLAPIAACGGSVDLQTYKFRNASLADLPYLGYIVLKSATDKVYLTTTGSTTTNYTNADIEAIAGVGIRRQLGSTGTYIIDFSNTNIASPATISLTCASRINAAMIQIGGGYSMSNFISPFPQKALVPGVTQTDCASATLNADASTSAPFQWFFNGTAIPGATASSYIPTQSGSYSYTATLECGTSDQSLPVTIALCNVDRVVTKAVNNPTPPVNGSVVFTIVASNTGAGEALGVSVTDLLPSGYSFISYTATAGTSYNNTTGIWSIGNLGAGISDTLKITAKVNASGSYTNTAIIHSTQSDPNTANDTASVATTPLTAITLTSPSTPPSDAQTVCINTPIVNITYAIGGSATGATVSGLPAGITYSYNSSSKVLTISGTPTVATTGPQTYTVTTTGGSSVATANGTIRVNNVVGTPVFALGSSSSRCQGAGSQFYTATAANTTGIKYTISTTSSQAVIDSLTGEVTFSALYSGTATITATAAGCTPKTATHTITTTSSGTVTGSSPVCSGSSGTLTLSGTSASVVRWEYSIDDGSTWATVLPNVTSTTLNYTGISANTSYRAVVTGGGCVEAYSSPFTVLVTQRPSVTDQSYNFCLNGSFNFAPVDVPTGTTFTWAAPSITGSVTGAGAGSNQPSVSQTLANGGTTVATANYTVTATNAGCAGNPFTISVTLTPSVNATAGSPGAICSGNSFSVTPTSTLPGVQYTWTASLISGTGITGFSDQVTAVAPPISQALTNTSSANGLVRYTVTPTLNGCTGLPFTFDVTVQGLVGAGSIMDNQLICNGSIPATITSVTDGTGSGTISYRWEQSTDGVVWSIISGANSAAYTPGALSQNTRFRRSTVSAVGSEQCFSDTTNNILISISDSSVITQQPGNDTTVNAGNAVFTVVAEGGSGTANYQWQVSTDGGDTWTDLSDGSMVSGATNDTLQLTNVLSTMDSYRYRALVTQSDNVCPAVISNSGVLRIDTDSDGVSDNDDIDDDNDGITDTVEGSGDKDGDGIPDYLDVDADNDGIVDAIESNGNPANDPDFDGHYGSGVFTDINGNGLNDLVDPAAGGTALAVLDKDGDGLANYLDIDADNDGVPDTYEAAFYIPDGENDGIIGTGPITDADHDGLSDLNDPDFVTVSTLFNQDRDFDGLSNYLDIDNDNDGITDNIEGLATSQYVSPTGLDTDGDGLDDAYDVNNGGIPSGYSNVDGGSGPDYIDTDSDNDGFRDWLENNVTSPLEVDNFNNQTGAAGADGLMDVLPDSDGDGLADIYDVDDGNPDPDAYATNGGQTPLSMPDVQLPGGDRDWRSSSDHDNDGVADGLDLDDDNDGILDIVEGTGDSDGDGIPNYFDLDSDGDGLPDVVEAGGLDPDNNGWPGTGVINSTNVDANGVPIAAGPSGYTPVDTDSDGSPDYLDLDSDGDTIHDVIENGGPDPDGDGLAGSGTAIDIDRDGIADITDDYNNLTGSTVGAPTGVPLTDIDADGDNIPNYRDLDSDNDGIIDSVEGSSDTDSDGLMNFTDIDADNDGIVDNIEAQATDPLVYIAPSGNDVNNNGIDDAYDATAGGTAITPVNTDGGDEPDYLDLDSDNDGDADALEAYDINNDGVAETLPSGTDIDNDGLDDSYDNNTSAINPTNGQTAMSFPNLDEPETDERDWREDYNISPVATATDMAVTEDVPTALTDISFADADAGNAPVTVTLSVDGGQLLAASGSGVGVAGSGTASLSLTGPIDSINAFIATNNLQYLTNPDANGSAILTIIIDDEGNTGGPALFDTVTVQLNITAVDDLPIALDDSFDGTEDTILSGNVAANDTLSGDGGNAWSIVDTPSNGVLTFNSDGTFTFEPDPDFNGVDTFIYQLCDSDGDCDTAIAVLNIASVNDLPIAMDDTASVDEDDILTGDVSINDSLSGDGGNIYTEVTPPGHGTLVLQDDGQYSYVPNSDYNGPDSFSYSLCDTNSDCDTAYVYINVISVNDLPEAFNDSFSVDEDIALLGTVVDNDIESGDGGNVWSLVGADGGANYGSVTMQPDGSFIYTPDIDFNGVDIFTYNICDTNGDCNSAQVVITVNAVNDIPVAVDDVATTDEDTDATGNLSANDTCGDGGCTYAVSGMPSNGTVIVNGDGTYTYTPSADFNGTDTFTYVVCDADDDCDTAQVVITVNAVNDIPVAVDDVATTNEDTDATGNLSTNDTCGDGGCTYAVSGMPSNGTVIVNGDGTYTYTPNADFNGTDTFTYVVCDVDDDCDTAQVVITVNAVNDIPVAVDDVATTDEDTDATGNLSANDTCGDGGCTYAVSGIPSNGTVVVNSDGTYTYTPNADFNGTDTFTYVVCDADDDCDTAQVVITVNAVNDIPVAVDDVATADEDTDATGNLSANDTCGDGGCTYAVSGIPSNGTVIVNGDGTYTYTPNADFNGTDTFTYVVCDADDDCDTAQVVITVNAVNDIPVAVDDNFSAGGSHDPVMADVSTNDTLGDGVNTFAVLDMPVHGSVVMDANGTFTYTPDVHFTGSDFFTYTICDQDGECDTATVYISGLLPVQLTSFVGKDAGNCRIDLNWNTGSEDGLQQFEIELSRDLRHYKSLGSITSKGNDSRYVFEYNNAESGVNYFRLKMVNEDGKYTYSKIVMVDVDCEEREIKVYPTVTSDRVTIEGLKAEESIRLYDERGRLMFEYKAESPVEQVDLSGMAQATYNLIIITDKKEQFNFKVIRQ